MASDNGWPDWAPRVCEGCGEKLTLRNLRNVYFSHATQTGFSVCRGCFPLSTDKR